MSRVLLLTDDLIREALMPPFGVEAPNRVFDGVASGIRATPQHRTVVDRLGGAVPALPAFGVGLADRRLGWMLAAAILAAMVIGITAVGAWLLRDSSVIELAPTGVEVLAPRTALDDVVVDGRGMGWAAGPGQVTRFDPATGERRVWTVADDGAFAETSIHAGARAGGVWMEAGPGLVRFDGTAFRDPVELPTDGLAAVAEAADGTLWALSDDSIWRRTGTSWQRLPGSDGCSDLVVSGSDDVWAGCLVLGREQVVQHLVDGLWTTYGADDLPILAGPTTVALAGGRDDDIWLGAGDAVARWSAGAWSQIEGPGFSVDELVALSNGGVMAMSLGDLATLARWDGSAWWPVATPDGFFAPMAISAAGTDILAATDAGLFRLGGSSWETASPEQLDRPSPPLSGFLTAPVVALSADEAWVVDDRGVWLYRDSQWVGPDRPPDLEPAARIWGLAISPNEGDLAIATDGGVAVRRDGIWSWGWRGAVWAVGYAPDGSIWAAAADHRLVHISEAGDGMVATTVTCPVGGLLLAVATDGSVFTGGIGYNGTGGLARADGTACKQVPGFGRGIEVVVLEPDPTGGAVAMILEGTDPPPWTASIVRSAGAAWSTLWSDDGTWDGYAGGMTVDDQGRVWLGGALPDDERGIQRFEAGAWRVVSDADLGTGLSVAPDGTLWIVGSSGIERISADQLH